MTQMIVVAAAAVGLMVFMAFVAARLVRARTAGMSIRMQIFLALSLVVGAFAFGLGLMVLDRVKARADLVGLEAAGGEARAVAAMVSAELAAGASLPELQRRLAQSGGPGATDELRLTANPPAGRMEQRSPAARPGTVQASAPVLVGGKPVARVWVVKPTLLIRKTLADFAPTVLVISLVLGAVAAVAAALIGRTIATPIEALSRFAERVSSGDLRAPPPVGHGREVEHLAHALDTMRRELQGRPFVETFAADLSHELKNPVAAIRASAEVLADGAIDDPADAKRFVARIQQATGRIEALLGDLLSLARLEARGVEQREPIDLREPAGEAVETARAAGTEVELSRSGRTEVRGERAWLARAIGNLIDNARLHGGPGPVRVVIERDEATVRCRISNAGRIQAAVRERLFRRFVTTRADRGGTGLGLAIARAIAEAHGGELDCVEPGPPEVCFELRLPAAP